VSGRLRIASLNGMQNMGFAFKRGLKVTRLPDFKDLDVSGTATLRYGARIDVTHNGQAISLMSVHLKSGCFENNSTSSAYARLMEQVPALERWTDDMAEGSNAFVVLGDFNRRFNLPGDTIWTEIDDANPRTQICWRSLRTWGLAVVITSLPSSLITLWWTDAPRSGLTGVPFAMSPSAKQTRTFGKKISDHCPVAVELWVQGDPSVFPTL
jgi:endonuclease/exonuclease/phosphatase family metal-dependent hydrolase